MTRPFYHRGKDGRIPDECDSILISTYIDNKTMAPFRKILEALDLSEKSFSYFVRELLPSAAKAWKETQGDDKTKLIRQFTPTVTFKKKR
jgi:hypothetical protein